MWACDFVQTYDLFFGTVFVFFIIDLSSRCVVYFNLTRAPTDVWTARQLRQSTHYDERPRFLIRDNDSKYGTEFNRVADITLIDVLRTPVRAPKANAICERFIGSVRRECLDHVLIINERQLYRLVKEYVEYFNHARPHQGIESQIPQPRSVDNRGASEGPMLTLPVLGGLHHDYRRAA